MGQGWDMEECLKLRRSVHGAGFEHGLMGQD